MKDLLENHFTSVYDPSGNPHTIQLLTFQGHHSFRIAMKIKRTLKVKGMTQAQLAETMGMDCAVISRYLSGKVNLELKTIVKIEKALGINIIDREIGRPLTIPLDPCI